MLQNAQQMYHVLKESSNEIAHNRDSGSECDKAESKQEIMSCMWFDITKNASHVSTTDMLQDLTKVDRLKLRSRVLMLIQPSS